MIGEAIMEKVVVAQSTSVVQDFMQFLLQVRHFSPRTATCYRSDILSFAVWLLGHRRPVLVKEYETVFQEADFRIRTATSEELMKFRGWLDGQGYQSSTVARCTCALRSLYKFMLRTGVRNDNPAVVIKKVKVERKKRVFPDDDMVQRLYNTLSESVGSDALRLRDFAILRLLIETGLPGSVIVEINCKDFDHGAQVISVGAFKKHAARRVQISSECCEILKKYMRARYNSSDLRNGSACEALFVNKHGVRLSERSMRRKIDKWVELAGFDTKISPRQLRNHFVFKASRRMELGDLASVLGHQSRKTTQDLVTQLSQM